MITKVSCFVSLKGYNQGRLSIKLQVNVAKRWGPLWKPTCATVSRRVASKQVQLFSSCTQIKKGTITSTPTKKMESRRGNRPVHGNAPANQSLHPDGGRIRFFVTLRLTSGRRG